MKKLFTVLVLTGLFAVVGAQVKSTELWTGPVIKYNISKKLRFDFEQQFRFNENISRYNYTLSEFSLRYKVFKYLNVKAIYRYYLIPSDAETIPYVTKYNKSRFSFDAATGTNIFNKDIKISYRIRYQDTWKSTSEVSKHFISTTNSSDHYIRNAFGLSYNLSKLVDPYLGWDNFFRLDGMNEIRQNRYTIGFEWKLTNDLDIDSYFHYEKEMNVTAPQSSYIIGLAAVYTFNYSKRNQSMDMLSPSSPQN